MDQFRTQRTDPTTGRTETSTTRRGGGAATWIVVAVIVLLVGLGAWWLFGGPDTVATEPALVEEPAGAGDVDVVPPPPAIEPADPVVAPDVPAAPEPLAPEAGGTTTVPLEDGPPADAPEGETVTVPLQDGVGTTAEEPPPAN